MLILFTFTHGSHNGCYSFSGSKVSFLGSFIANKRELHCCQVTKVQCSFSVFECMMVRLSFYEMDLNAICILGQPEFFWLSMDI
jgi:hypothetical protein